MQRYTATQVNAELFYKLPKFLLQNKNYKEMSNDAKLLYVILKDRYQYSLSSGWVDENQNVYIYFSTKEIKEVLNIGINKVSKLKKELIKTGLLEVVKQGFNKKTQKNYPDRLYLLQPDYDPKDLISQASHAETLAQSGFTKTVISTKPHDSNKQTSENPSENCNKHASALEPCDITKTVTYQDKNKDTILDTIKDTQAWDFSVENYSQEEVQKQNKDLLSHMGETLTSNDQMFLSSESINIISSWFRTPEAVSDCISTILNAATDSRSDAVSQLGHHELHFEDYQEELKHQVTITLRRFFNKMRTSKKDQIRDPKAYLYASMRTLFDGWQNRIMMENKEE